MVFATSVPRHGGAKNVVPMLACVPAAQYLIVVSPVWREPLDIARVSTKSVDIILAAPVDKSFGPIQVPT